MTRQCCICGKAFAPQKKNQVTCGADECQKERHRIYLRSYMERYRAEHRAEINQKNKEYMRRVRSGEQSEEDTFAGLNYAERQMAKTLAMVGRIRTEL